MKYMAYHHFNILNMSNIKIHSNSTFGCIHLIVYLKYSLTDLRTCFNKTSFFHAVHSFNEFRCAEEFFDEDFNGLSSFWYHNY